MERYIDKDNLYELVTVEEKIKCLPSNLPCKEFIKEKTLVIPCQKPKIEQLAKIIIKPQIISHKTICTPEGHKAIIEGKIIEKIFYVADKPDQPVHSAHFSFPFCQFIKLPRHFKVKDIKVKTEEVILNVINKRKITQCIFLFICAIPKQCHSHHDC